MDVSYVKYTEMREFYTVREACKFFSCEKAELKRACEKYGLEPRPNESGENGFPRHDVCKLHNALYHEKKAKQEEDDDPWA